MRSGALPTDSADAHTDSPDVPRARLDRAGLAVVREVAATGVTLAHERTLPVVDGLQSLLPSGAMQRGSSYAVHGVGATSFALALAGQAVRDGSFLAVIAPESFGLAACLDFDIPLRRVVQFALPPGDELWSQAVAAVIEGFDVVILADRRQVRASSARQLIARTRERGSIVIRVGGPAWPAAADIRFDIADPQWSGLGRGHGHLQARQVAVRVAGRRYHGRQGSHDVLLPAKGGGVAGVSTQQEVDVVGESAKFAGSDIDELLAAVDGNDGASEPETSNLDASGLDAPELDAIA